MEQARKLEIGARIKELRERSPYRQPDMAEKLGVGLRAYQALEAKGTTKWERVEEIAEIHEVQPLWIWDGREKPPTPNVLGALNGDSVLHEIRADVKAILSRLDAAGAAQAAAAQIEDDARARRRRGRAHGEAGPASGEQRRGE